eukprot:Gb_21409 [translate_table: standard]
MARDRRSFHLTKGRPVSAIDHIVCRPASGRCPFFKGEGDQVGKPLGFQGAKINEVRDEIRLSNRWEPLERLDCSLEEGVELGVKSFMDISMSIASSVGVIGDAGARRPRSGVRVTGRIKRLIQERRRCFREVLRARRGSSQEREAVELWEESKAATKKECARENWKVFQANLEKGRNLMDINQPMRNEEGALITNPPDVLESWQRHYVKGQMDSHQNDSKLCSEARKVDKEVGINRIDSELEERKFFTKSQAGFRKGEECVAQVVALKEIILRRNIKWQKATYVAFINFKKAYDMVPHEALMKKLRAAGVAGKALDFFRNLYSSTSVKLKEMLKKVHEWAQKWGMACGIDKCKAMVVFGDQDRLKLEELLIGEERMGACESYKYLGLEIDSRLSVERMIKERAVAGRKALYGMRHFSVDKRIPTWATVLAFKALVHHCLTFGAEVIGMHDQSKQRPLQRVVVEGIKWMVGKSARSSAVGATVLHRELNVCSIATFNAGQRARGFFKYRGLKTRIADLVNFLGVYRVGEKWSWVQHTKKWIAKNAPRCQSQGLLVREATWEAWESKHSTEALQFYKEFKLEGSSEFFKRAMRYEDVTLEKVRLLILARVGGCLLVKRAVRLGLVDHRIGVRCLLCNEEGGDSLFHVLVKYLSLDHIRSRIEGLETLVSKLWLTSAANDDKSWLTLLLGGEIGGRLCNWLWGRLHWRGTVGFVHVANLLAEVIPTYDQALREWEVRGDGSQLDLARGPSGSDTTFEPTLERTSCVSDQPGWVYLILRRIPRVTGTESESFWPVRILQAMLEHGSLISSGRVFEP